MKNDFGAQVRFFGDKGTSFVGGVALKTGNVMHNDSAYYWQFYEQRQVTRN